MIISVYQGNHHILDVACDTNAYEMSLIGDIKVVSRTFPNIQLFNSLVTMPSTGLKEFLVRHNLTQKKAATLLGLSQSTISRYVNNPEKVPPHVVPGLELYIKKYKKNRV